jgi:excisionase family DNA binding protein
MTLSVSAPGPSRPPADREWLSPAEVAGWLGVSEKLVYRLCEDPTFPAVKVGGLMRIRASRLEKWLERQHPVRLRAKQGSTRPLASQAAGPSPPGVTAPTAATVAETALPDPAERPE